MKAQVLNEKVTIVTTDYVVIHELQKQGYDVVFLPDAIIEKEETNKDLLRLSNGN